MKKYIVLVAGYDYNGGGTDFAYLAEKRRLFLLRENPAWANDGNVIFVRFDAKTGKVQRNTSNGTSRKWSDEALAFDAVNRRQHYSGKVLKQEATNLLSITDAYRYVINIGDTDPGSLHEFSILGHGWFGGPILLNSTQRPDYSAGQNLQLVRDPYDKDGRHKDFFPENMAIDDWIKFKAAFSPQGYCWVWGCVFTRVYFNTLHRVINSDSFKRKAFGTHADDDEIVISVNASFARTYYKNDIMFFPASTTEVTFNRTIGDLKAFLIRGLRRCYPGRLAADTGIECRAAFLGTYADYERVYRNHRPAHTVMEIPRNFSVYGSDFTKLINFYKTYLNFPEDPENRGYGCYTSSMINGWWP